MKRLALVFVTVAALAAFGATSAALRPEVGDLRTVCERGYRNR